jgi:AraC-like DNA-binding protein
MLPEGTPHRVRLKKGHKRLEQISIHCHIQDRWGRSLLSRFPSPVGQLSNRRASEQVLKELTCLMSRDSEIGRLYGETVLKDLLVAQIRQGEILTRASNADLRVGSVIQRMEKELDSVDLSIEDLARGVEITPVQLRKLFRRETGTGPKQFLSALRFRKASRLLRHTRAAVKKIAAECGFASDHYFHLAFRQEFGCTPSEYRTRTVTEV